MKTVLPPLRIVKDSQSPRERTYFCFDIKNWILWYKGRLPIICIAIRNQNSLKVTIAPGLGTQQARRDKKF